MEFQLEKRHGHHASKVHVKTANIFIIVFFVAMSLYAVLKAINAKYRKVPRLIKILESPILVTVAWMLLISWGIFHHFSSNIMQIARRYGQLALATSTLSIFLAAKPAIFPYTYQVRLVRIHKWIGRSSVVCAAVHGIIYICAYIRKTTETPSEENSHATDKRHGGHDKKLFSTLNILGMISLLAYFVIFSTSLGKVRRKAYYIFYALHRPLVILIYMLMIWHAHPRSWLLVPLGLLFLVVQILIKVLMSRSMKVTSVQSFGPSLKLITFDPPFSESSLGKASHIRLTTPFTNPIVFFRSSHPYTLVGKNKLILRESRFKIIEGGTYRTYGPFVSSFDPTPYTHLLVFAGGSGVSLIPSLRNSVKNEKFVWITRSIQEISILSEFGINCDIFISGVVDKLSEYNTTQVDEFELAQFEIDSDNEEATNGLDEEQTVSGLGDGITMQKQQYRHGRPDFNEAADSFYNIGPQNDSQSDQKLCIVACGPQELVDAATKWAEYRGYDIWTEVFAI